MSRFNTRLRRLFARTHRFLSVSELRLGNDAMRDRLQRAGVTKEQYFDAIKKLRRLSNRMTRYNATAKDRADFFDQLESDRLAKIAFLLDGSEKVVELLSRGAWVYAGRESWMEEAVRIARTQKRREFQHKLWSQRKRR